MTSLLEGAKKLVSRSPDLASRVQGLESAVDAATGRLDESLIGETQQVVERATGRLRLSADHTVVALAGATGSGKSSTFNALTDLELSAVGVRRPTTSWATACVWGSEGAAELLEWLGIPARHQITRDSMLSTGREDDALKGTILLDLPDHDSTEVSHHLEVDRLVQLADLLVWVLDPQKYADAAVHDRYLAPLAGHADVMVVVLNQLDRVPEDRRAAMLADVRRLLEQDGLGSVPVIGVSAKQGWGIDELKSEIRTRVEAKKATRARLVADLRTAAERLGVASGEAPAAKLSKERIASLNEALANSAGVPTVVEAVAESTRLRASRATGWPLVAWAGRLRPDPLKRLHLDLGTAGKMLTGSPRTSIPQATQVQRAQVDAQVRALAEDATTAMNRPWVDSVRRASVARLPETANALDKALAETDLGVERLPWWTSMVHLLQWLFILCAAVGGGWLALLAFGSFLGLPEVHSPEVGGLPLPTFLFIGGLGLGILLALACRLLVASTARAKARTADKKLRRAISDVADELVVRPVQAELEAYERVRAGVVAARS